MKQVRESNFELLRILSMFMIVVWHLGSHGLSNQINVYEDLSSANTFLYQFIRFLSVIAVNCYLLISGYFLSQSNFKLTRLIKLLVQVFSFSIIIYMSLVILGIEQFKLIHFVMNFFPTFFIKYWFVSIYIIVYVLSPFMNILINNMKKKEYLALLATLFFILSLWQFIFPSGYLGVNSGYSPISFIFLYLLGGYIRKYGAFFKSLKQYQYLSLYLLIAALSASIVIKYSVFRNYLFHYNSPNVIIMAFCLFMVFYSFSFQSKSINTLSKYVFGVYLIHDNKMIRRFLWSDYVPLETIVEGPFIIIKILVSSSIIFLACLFLSFIIELISNQLYEMIVKLYGKMKYKLYNAQTKKITDTK